MLALPQPGTGRQVFSVLLTEAGGTGCSLRQAFNKRGNELLPPLISPHVYSIPIWGAGDQNLIPSYWCLRMVQPCFHRWTVNSVRAHCSPWWPTHKKCSINAYGWDQITHSVCKEAFRTSIVKLNKRNRTNAEWERNLTIILFVS